MSFKRSENSNPKINEDLNQVDMGQSLGENKYIENIKVSHKISEFMENKHDYFQQFKINDYFSLTKEIIMEKLKVFQYITNLNKFLSSSLENFGDLLNYMKGNEEIGFDEIEKNEILIEFINKLKDLLNKFDSTIQYNNLTEYRNDIEHAMTAYQHQMPKVFYLKTSF